jgi:hypothetical protein
MRDAALAVACTQGRHAAGEVLQKPKLRRKRGSGGPSPRQRKGERNLQRQAGEAAASASVAVQTRERDAEYQADLPASRGAASSRQKGASCATQGGEAADGREGQ